MTIGLSEAGISPSDFEEGPFRTFARDITRVPITKTISNLTGSPEYSEGQEETIKAIITKRTQRYDFSKEGLTDMGDAFMQVLPNTTINKEDLIKFDNEIYRVDEVLVRVPAGSIFFKSCILFKVENE